METPVISVKNLSFSYDGRKNVLTDIDLDVFAGEKISVIGRNGSGKSTLAKLLNGLLVPTAGKVLVEGKDTADKTLLRDIRRTVGVVFQNPDNQLVASIVEDDVAFGPENIGLPREEIGERINFALSAVNMSEFKDRTPSHLSGGQKQRIAIAGVLAVMPKVIILDESTAMLDPKGRKEVTAVAERLNKEKGITVINITHYIEETANADKIIVLDDGKIAFSGKPREVFKREKELERLGLTIPLSSKIAHELYNNGVIDTDDVVSEEELEVALCASLQKD